MILQLNTCFTLGDQQDTIFRADSVYKHNAEWFVLRSSHEKLRYNMLSIKGKACVIDCP